MPPALPSDAFEATIWRVVEAQHIVSTSALVDSGAEQALLEDVLERSKPPVPPACQHLHYLMAAPFRYGKYPWDSRFRRKGQTPGVFYGALDSATAVAETLWYKRRFFAASPGTPLPKKALEYTGFAVAVSTPVALDLTEPPLSARKTEWTDPDDYTACLALADEARSAGIEAIAYESVRDPRARKNVAVLTCPAFAAPAPVAWESWHIILRDGSAQAIREHPRENMEFFVNGTRLAFTA